jgi:SAM-dependent methyltransferase
MTKQNKSTKKKPYQKPKLKALGSIKNITQSGSTTGGPDGGTPPGDRMMCLSLPPEIEEHRYLVGDQNATRGLKQAIEDVVQNGDRVIDLGAGTGILSFFAVEAGAAHVDAIEMRPILRAAKIAAEQNGMSDKITFHAGQSEKLALENKADVIISNLGFLNTLVSLPDAIKRLLKAGGRYFPTSIQMEIAPLDASGFQTPSVGFWKEKHHGYDMSAFLTMAQHPFYQALDPKTFLGAATELEPIQISADMPDQFTWNFECKIQNAGTLSGLAGYYNFFNGDDVYLSLRPPINLDPMIWGGYVFPLVNPIAVKAGDVLAAKFELQLSGNPVWAWKIDLNGKTVGDHSNLGAVWPIA